MNYKRLAIATAMGAVVMAVLFVFDPSASWLIPKCVFKSMTGLSCPSCGIQRFIHAALHGHFAEAIRYNYFLAYSLPYALLLLAGWVGAESRWARTLVRITHNHRVVWGYVVAFLLWMIVRNIINI